MTGRVKAENKYIQNKTGRGQIRTGRWQSVARQRTGRGHAKFLQMAVTGKAEESQRTGKAQAEVMHTTGR